MFLNPCTKPSAIVKSFLLNGKYRKFIGYDSERQVHGDGDVLLSRNVFKASLYP